MPRKMFEFVVPGKPVQQGSKTSFVSTNRTTGKSRSVMYDANAKALKPFRARVAEAARQAWLGPRLEGALLVVLEFRFERGVTVKRSFMTVKPDIDKLERSILDALTDSKTIRDDAQVVEVRKKKVYGREAGVSVVVGEFQEREWVEE